MKLVTIFEGFSEQNILRKIVSRCWFRVFDAIYFLDGWEDSAGAKIEFDYACRKNKGICFKDIQLE